MNRTKRLKHARLLVVVLIALALVPFAAPVAEAGSTTRVLEITNASARPTVAFKSFDGNPPKVYDINGDGKMEIIVQNDNHWVYVFDSKSGELLAEVKAKVPSNWGARTFNGPEAAVLKQGGEVHLITASSASVIAAWRFDHWQSTPDNFHMEKVWERRVNDCYSDSGMDAKVVFADLDRDGDFEILAATEEKGLYALNHHDGSIYWKNCLGGGNAAPSVGDLDQDGFPEVVHVSDGGTVSALNGKTGGWKWSYNVKSDFNLGSGSMPVQAGIGQLDGRGGPDITVGARDSHNPDNWPENHALLLALDSNGKLLWGKKDQNGGNPLTYTRSIIADADKDGKNEVYWADWNTVGHKPPAPGSGEEWAVTGPGNFYRYDAAGNMVWKTSLDTWWSNKDIAIADVDGDGIQEVLANGPNGGHDGIWYLDVRNGAKEAFVDVYPWKVQRAPVVADLWGTGTTQWVLQAAPATSSAGGHAILVYDTGAPYDAVWPHVPYPSVADQPTQPPDEEPPSGDFDATFKGVGGNEWWIQTQVDTMGGTLAKVEVSLNGGSWKALKDEGWGWAASYHAPQGTIVQLRATSTGGATDTSGCYLWTGATATTCDGGGDGEPEGVFEATFSGVQGNEWWIQTQVSTSGGTLSTVDARLNGGSWKPLKDEGWGWAASYHAPQGTVVQLRATSGGGDRDLSDCYRWTDATKVSCPSSSSTFTAQFSNVRGNEWWIETEVATSGGTLAGVDARVNGGSWVALDLKSWGSWAKSIHAPAGSEVQFRASSTSGSTVLSGTYSW